MLPERNKLGKPKELSSAKIFPSTSSQLAGSAWSSDGSQETLRNAQEEEMFGSGGELQRSRLLATFHARTTSSVSRQSSVWHKALMRHICYLWPQ